MCKNKILFVLGLALMLPTVLMAQTITVPYFMGFEDAESAELSNWVLNSGAQAASCADRWIVGSSQKSSGSKALYIATGGSTAAQFGSDPCLQYAYRDIVLPNGMYDISFDWYCVGSSNASLRYGYIQGTSVALDANASSGNINATINGYLQSNVLRNSQSWQNESFQFRSRGTAIRLFFVWSNNNTDSTLANPVGGCIDNIQITSANSKRPSNVTATALSCDSVLLSWSGTSGEYQLGYRKVGALAWQTISNLPGGSTGSTVVENLDEGSYDFRVRGINTVDTSAWTYLSSYVVFCPERHCINYVDLTAPGVVCTYGDGYNGYHSNPQCAYENRGVIDYGPDDMRSRHTVNWDRTAKDPRTGNALSLVPANDYASIRLGNWDTNGEAESVSFSYLVDSANAILLMKYAIVLQDPDHDSDEQPRFVLDILDEHGDLVDPTCGHCNFAANSKASGWHTYGSGYDMVTWKDWTTVGLHLQDYVGQVLTIRLTTYDCSLYGHYGYAYFTLDCASATIETKSCAKDPSVGMNLKAPDGFRYQWYDKYDNPIPGATSSSFVPTDTATYRCRLTSLEEGACYFDLYSQCIPRLPKPEFKAIYAPEKCVNRVKIQNNSYVLTILRNDTIKNLKEKCDVYQWEVSSAGVVVSTAEGESPIFSLPSDGGTYDIRLTALLNGGCEESIEHSITLPKIQDTFEAFDTLLCQGEFIQWGDKLIAQSGVYPLELKSVAGCDSVREMTVHILPNYSIELDTAYICFGDKYCVDGDCYRGTESGMFVRNLQTTLGCDSTVLQYVEIADEIIPVFTIDSINLEKEKYTADIEVSGTGFDHFEVMYVEDDTIREYHLFGEGLHNLKANIYHFTLYNSIECAREEDIVIGGTCLDITLEPQQQCEDNQPVIIYPYVVNEGIATRYSVAFSDKAKAAGFTDISKTSVSGGEIQLAIPDGLRPDRYEAEITFEDFVCGDKSFLLDIMVTYPSTVIFHRWDDVISVKNADAAGYGSDFAFDSYEWYLNGAPVDGAWMSYYNQRGGLQMDGEYQVKMRRTDGVEFMTCPYIPNRHLTVTPTQAPQHYYNVLGQPVDESHQGVTVYHGGKQAILIK
ncbi:MAG: fibronectin type III domain-containing protein [Paludibacteraceae bacterium]|nr:fibronectin type III domain-containing protein [Paludibacteraceae bacterium]